MNEPTEQTSENKALLKKQCREEKKQEREIAAKEKQQQRMLKKVLMWGVPILIISAGVWVITRSPGTSDESNPLISRRGIHWHPNLEIWIKGERVTIPANIGLGAVHSDTHT
ncbi:MAG: hypothetical protein ACREQV_24600, partial [Candidatus Binatia bacterium]